MAASSGGGAAAPGGPEFLPPGEFPGPAPELVLIEDGSGGPTEGELAAEALLATEPVPEWIQRTPPFERRVDPSDGFAYLLSEFRDTYGDYDGLQAMWDMCEVYVGPETNVIGDDNFDPFNTNWALAPGSPGGPPPDYDAVLQTPETYMATRFPDGNARFPPAELPASESASPVTPPSALPRGTTRKPVLGAGVLTGRKPIPAELSASIAELMKGKQEDIERVIAFGLLQRERLSLIADEPKAGYKRPADDPAPAPPMPGPPGSIQTHPDGTLAFAPPYPPPSAGSSAGSAAVAGDPSPSSVFRAGYLARRLGMASGLGTPGSTVANAGSPPGPAGAQFGTPTFGGSSSAAGTGSATFLVGGGIAGPSTGAPLASTGGMSLLQSSASTFGFFPSTGAAAAPFSPPSPSASPFAGSLFGGSASGVSSGGAQSLFGSGTQGSSSGGAHPLGGGALGSSSGGAAPPSSAGMFDPRVDHIHGVQYAQQHAANQMQARLDALQGQFQKQQEEIRQQKEDELVELRRRLEAERQARDAERQRYETWAPPAGGAAPAAAHKPQGDPTYWLDDADVSDLDSRIEPSLRDRLLQHDCITRPMRNMLIRNNVCSEQSYYNVGSTEAEARNILADLAGLRIDRTLDGYCRSHQSPAAMLKQIWDDLHDQNDPQSEDKAKPLTLPQVVALEAKAKLFMGFRYPSYLSPDESWMGKCRRNFVQRRYEVHPFDNVKCAVRDSRVSDSHAADSSNDKLFLDGMAFDGSGDAKLTFAKKKESHTFRLWWRGQNLGYHGVETVGNAVHNCKNDNGDVIPWLSHTVVLEILSRMQQYCVDAGEQRRVNFENARSNELDFRRVMFDMVRDEGCSLDHAYYAVGKQQLQLLFQYQNNQSQGGYRQPSPKKAPKTKGARKGGYVPYSGGGGGGGGRDKGSGKGKDKRGGDGGGAKTRKSTSDFVREPSKPHLYQSYKGQRYCINWNLHGNCKFGKNCNQLHFCNYVGCDKGHIKEGCRSGDSSKHRW